MPDAAVSQGAAPNQAPVPAKRRRNKKKTVKRIVAIIVAAAIVAGIVFALRSFLGSSNSVSEIYAQPAYIGSIQSRVSGSGNARASQSAAITLTQSGTVETVYVTSGQMVMAGDPLYTIYSQAAQDAVAAAQEAVTAAEGAVVSAQRRADVLTEELETLRQSVKDLTVRAPYAGKLMDVEAFSPGQEVSSGAFVATLVNDRQLRLSLYFSYAYENDIAVGQEAQVSIPAVMGSFTGTVEKINRVSYISPEGGKHFEVVIVFDNPGTLTADMLAYASLTGADGRDIYPYDSGRTQYYETCRITARGSGPVESMGMLLNYADVEAGEVLLVLGRDALDGELRAKQTEIDGAQENTETARKAVDEARKTLDDAIKALEAFNAVAPIDGTVTSCTLTEGAEVKGGDTVIIISNTTSMLVNITVDDRNISFIKPGDMVELSWNGNSYMGTVTAIDMGGAESGQGMTNYPVTLSVENWDGSLMDGAWLQYSFVTSQSEDCVLVPTSAVQYFSDKEGNRQSVVFVKRDARPDNVPELELPAVESGQTRRFPSEEEGYYPVIVATGLSDAQVVEIVSGVEAGDEVFVNYTVTDYGSSW